MRIHQQISPGQALNACPCGLGGQPHAYVTRGQPAYFIEHSPCGRRSASAPTLSQAVDDWNGQRQILRLRRVGASG